MVVVSKDEINAFLGAGTVYEGKLSFKGSVRIDGTYTGQITSEGSLIVGKDALITGEVRVGELLLSGKLMGDVHAARAVTIYKGGLIEGTLHTPTLVTEEGGRIQGHVNMQTEAAPAKK